MPGLKGRKERSPGRKPWVEATPRDLSPERAAYLLRTVTRYPSTKESGTPKAIFCSDMGSSDECRPFRAWLVAGR